MNEPKVRKNDRKNPQPTFLDSHDLSKYVMWDLYLTISSEMINDILEQNAKHFSEEAKKRLREILKDHEFEVGLLLNSKTGDGVVYSYGAYDLLDPHRLSNYDSVD